MLFLLLLLEWRVSAIFGLRLCHGNGNHITTPMSPLRQWCDSQNVTHVLRRARQRPSTLFFARSECFAIQITVGMPGSVNNDVLGRGTTTALRWQVACYSGLQSRCASLFPVLLEIAYYLALIALTGVVRAHTVQYTRTCHEAQLRAPDSTISTSSVAGCRRMHKPCLLRRFTVFWQRSLVIRRVRQN